MEGLITKILSDKCYVKINKEVVICGFRGKIRAQKLLPLVGDKVIIDKEKKIIEKILNEGDTGNDIDDITIEENDDFGDGDF